MSDDPHNPKPTGGMPAAVPDGGGAGLPSVANKTLWQRIQAGIEEARRRTLGAFLEAMAARKARRDEVSFSIALIALSAKMAKADGVVTDDEVAAFRDFFSYPPEEESKVRMLYQLAQQDVAGYDLYLERVAKLYDGQCPVLEDVLDCLFYVSMADGVAHPEEVRFLDVAAEKFDIKPAAYRRLKALHLGIGDDDPWLVLGLEPGLDQSALKKAYHALVRENHPDAMVARGVPIDLIKIAESRMAAINTAYEKILAERD